MAQENLPCTSTSSAYPSSCVSERKKSFTVFCFLFFFFCMRKLLFAGTAKRCLTATLFFRRPLYFHKDPSISVTPLIRQILVARWWPDKQGSTALVFADCEKKTEKKVRQFRSRKTFISYFNAIFPRGSILIDHIFYGYSLAAMLHSGNFPSLYFWPTRNFKLTIKPVTE